MTTGVYRRLSAEQRFWAKVKVQATGCWNWTGYLNPDGYGQFSVHGRPTLVHRWSYEYHSGSPIPSGLVIDHLCRNPSCVNPAHLDCVPMRVNTERGLLYETLRANAKKKTHCKRGHELFGANLLIDYRGHRGCITCRAMKAREWKLANRPRVNELQQIRRKNSPKPSRPVEHRRCPHCDREFEAKQANSRYCSSYCYKTAWRDGTTSKRRQPTKGLTP